jgi:regulator of RNase E activity RraA
MKTTFSVTIFVISALFAQAQSVGASPEYVKALTSRWNGERFADGRPNVPDIVLESIKKATQEEIWDFLGSRGFRQMETDWLILKPGETMVGRAVTAQYMPSRPDLDSMVRATAVKEARTGGSNVWPINILTKGDVYIADGYGKVGVGSTLIGSSLGNAIYGKSGNGVVFNGGIRDMQELRATPGFNAWVRGQHPSAIAGMLCTGINVPINIGQTTVLPGDIIFANEFGVTVIPAYLAVELSTAAQLTALHDEYERVLLSSGKYPAEQIHGTWSDEIKNMYRAWFAKLPKGKTTVTQAQLEASLNRGQRPATAPGRGGGAGASR